MSLPWMKKPTDGARGPLTRPFFVALSCCVTSLTLTAADVTPATPASQPLALSELIQKVLTRNDSLQAKFLELQASQKRVKAEKGLYEPDFVASYEKQGNRRRNNAEQQSQQSIFNSTRIFDENNNVYNAGLESLVPMGGRVRLGYTLRDLDNNLQPSLGVTSEYQTFVGLSVTQPLLKNFGSSATLANLRLASLASDVSFQEYRRQLMLTLSSAEGSYWNLYLAQEQVHFFEESVNLADTILRDAKAKWDAGKSSELEVQEAQSALALRRSRLVDAEQKRFEATTRLTSLYASADFGSNQVLVAVDLPKDEPPPDFSFQASAAKAFDSNPDYAAQRKKMDADHVRLAYARNQRMPQLDLKASLGLNGLGETMGLSWDQVTKGSYPSWTAGLELRIPILGGTKSRNELEAARLKTQQALYELKELETQIYNALDNAHHKILSARKSVGNYRQVVEFNQNLLKSQISRLEAGKIEPRKVLEVEADLLEARSAAAEALVQYRRALIELELIEGSFLIARSLDVDAKELAKETREMIRSTAVPAASATPAQPSVK